MANNDASADADIDLKKRARRRLVGAAALALFGVVVLSLTMEQSPGVRSGAGTQDTPEILIPSQSGRAALAARPAPAAPAASPHISAGNAETASDEPPVAAPRADGTAANVKDMPAASPPLKPVEKITESAPVKAGKSLDKPTEKAVDRKVEEAKATAALEGKSSGQWVVQLGAYQSAGNVKLLLSKLKEVGVPAYTEKFESPQGVRTRVRAGPFNSREAAEKSLRKIRIVGVDGPIAQK
ncbi:hypothetical protein B9N43_07560 [Denitratisoma sp. DHT3]|uniref:SPOR domain-containing protein n=1 Tax=Denitratisoma sp. DHT3 TaxID=1981880 RepID=UPI0011982C64|nr:SPOR domain-containing protein [Denitratisoma sp. DHT3]QDX81108.1 hypothetical protein B9N43_07560 [Denitratisoma sp. DHT3]